MRREKKLQITTVKNHKTTDGNTIISILVPYFCDDPTPLIEALSNQNTKQVELVLYDDGSLDGRLTQKVTHAIQSANMPVRLLIANQNMGRSAARNHLEQAAHADYVLFLDADMMPDKETFLQTYIEQIKQNNVAIVFGGFSVAQETIDHKFDLHRALSAGSDCLPAAQRNLLPAKHVCSSNLLVRKDVLSTCPFDTGFIGWGWEDVEWAARAAEHYPIIHIDNPALHLGLESAETLVRRYRESAGNYARFAARHPDLAQQLPSYRTAKLARRIPGLKLLRPVLSALARDPWHLVPMKIRIFALKLWRAGWYAETLV